MLLSHVVSFFKGAFVSCVWNTKWNNFVLVGWALLSQLLLLASCIHVKTEPLVRILATAICAHAQLATQEGTANQVNA